MYGEEDSEAAVLHFLCFGLFFVSDNFLSYHLSPTPLHAPFGLMQKHGVSCPHEVSNKPVEVAMQIW